MFAYCARLIARGRKVTDVEGLEAATAESSGEHGGSDSERDQNQPRMGTATALSVPVPVPDRRRPAQSVK